MLLAGLKRAINDVLNDFQENRCIGCYRCARERLSIAIYVFHKDWIKKAIICLSLDQIFSSFQIILFYSNANLSACFRNGHETFSF